MSATLELQNYESVNIKNDTNVAATITQSGVPVSLQVTNSIGFQVGDIVIIGRIGAESSEKQTITAIADATHITVSALDRNHTVSEKITSIVGDYLVLFRAPIQAAGAQPDNSLYVQVGTPIPMLYDSMTTLYNDSTGSASFYYKYVYQNSATLAQTSLDIAVANRPTGDHYTTLTAIRSRAGFANNRAIVDDTIDEMRTTAEDHVNSRLSGRYIVPFTAPISPTISEITKMYAAGLLLNDQYPYAGTVGVAGPGDEFMTWADKQLATINSGDTPIVGATGQPTTSSSVDGGFSGFPNAEFVGPVATYQGPNGTILQAGGEGFMFERKMIDGYGGRFY